MPKKILLIENDAAFAETLSGALDGAGFETRTTGDGKEGLDLARDWAPDGIVLCVELPGMSGYLVCQRLKKDEALKPIPLVLTSAEATEETFDKHKALKARADDYLLKPFEPAALVEKLGALVGLPEPAERGAAHHDEELVSLEEEIGLDAAEGQPDAEIPGLDLESLPDEPAAARGAAGGEDDDLKLLDEAFEGLATSAPDVEDAATALDLELSGERAVAGEDVDAAAASLPDGDEGGAGADLGALADDADRALGALGEADESLSPPDAEPATRPVRGASADLLRAAGIKLLDEPTGREPRAEARADAPDGDAARRLERTLAARDADLKKAERKAADLARRADQAEADAEKARADAEASRDALREAEAEVAELRRRVADAEEEARRAAEEARASSDASAKIEALERETDELRAELLAVRGEADGARGEVEKRTADLRRRLAEVEATSAKNEERVVKAYQKIKADEKIREKVRKALGIATQLLDDGTPDAGTEKDRRATGAVGRE